MQPSELRELIQTQLAEAGFYDGAIDSDFGPLTFAALQKLDLAPDHEDEIPLGWHKVKATIFADEGDVARFKRCRELGNSEQFCFKTGDNGVGKWGDDTTVDQPYCALPREDWEFLGGEARGKIVEVQSLTTGMIVECELRDTMPARRNITNHAGIDLNPCAFRMLGFKNGEGKALWRFKP